MRTALLGSVLALLLTLVSPHAEARKIFIREIRVAPACVAVSSEAMLALIAQQVPRDVLARRDLQYEDLPSYLDLANWNPERFEVRQTTNIVRRLHQLDMRYMIWLELSCLPPGGPARYMLTGRLTDLDVMNRILTCPASQAGSRDGRRVCNVNGEVYDAVSYTTVQMTDFEGFVPAVRELLARLLHVPEISVGTATRVFDPSSEVDVPFLVRRNDGTEPGYSGSPASVRGYRMQQDVVQLPSDLYTEVCNAPALRWNQLACRGGFADGRCDAADRVNYEVRSLVHQEVAARALPVVSEGERGGDRIAFRAPGYESFFLVRAEAIADERGGAVRSNPVFACLHVRSRSRHFGFATSIGIPWSTLAPDPRDRAYPAAALIDPAVSFELWLNSYLFSTRRSLFPNSYLGVVLGLTRMSGVYPCPDENLPRCSGTPLSPLRPHHVSTSWTTEVRVQLRNELFRVGRMAPILLTDIGLGLEYLHSDSAFRNDGWGMVFLPGVGAGVQFTAGRPGTVEAQVWFAVQFQARIRLETRAVPVILQGGQSWFDAAGVPDLVQAVWFTLGSSFAFPRASN